MKKNKGLYFAIYAVILLIVVVTAILIIPRFVKSGNSDGLPPSSNNTNDGTGGDVDASDKNDDDNEHISTFKLNCAESYKVKQNATIKFKDGFYTCEEPVVIKLENAEQPLLDNELKFLETGTYNINFYTTVLEASITIEVEKQETSTLTIGESIALENLTTKPITIANDKLTIKGNSIYANKAGASELQILDEQEFVSITNYHKVIINPTFNMYNENMEYLENDSIKVYTFENFGNLYIEVNAGNGVSYQTAIQINGTKYNFEEGFVSIELLGNTEGTLIIDIDGCKLEYNFNIITAEF